MELRLKFIFVLVLGLLASMSLMAQKPTPPKVRAMPNDTMKVKAWSRLCSSFLQTDLDSAMAYADSTLALATRLGYEKGIALGNEKIGIVYNYRGKINMSLTYFEKALQYHLDADNDRSASIIMTNMGLAKRNLGDFDEAMVYYFDALALREKSGDTNGISFILKSIGEAYAIQLDYDNAEEYFIQALEGFRSVKNAPMENTMILNMGGFYREKGNLEKAEDFILRAKEYFEKNGPPIELARAYYNLGGLYLARDLLAQSDEAYRRAMGYYDSLGAKMRVTGCLISLSEVNEKQGNFQMAVSQVKQALSMAEELGTKSQISRALIRLSNIYENANDYKSALEYRVLHEEMEDSISNEEKQHTIAELQEKYQSELGEQKLAEVTARNAVNELKVKKQQNQQIALVGMMFLSLVVAVLLFNQYREKKKTNELLLEKNTLVQSSLHEKEVLLKEIHHRVKNNLQFISSLLNLQARHVTDPETLKVLKEGKHRVNSMSLVHQKLYQEENLKGVEMSSYIANMLDSLIHSYQIDRTKVSVETDLQKIYLDIDSAIPVGLIMNELITNVLKYAFGDRDRGQLAITLKEEGQQLLLSVADDGIGLPDGFSFEENEQFGLELVQSLATKLKASIEVNTDNGTRISLHIHKYNKA